MSKRTVLIDADICAMASACNGQKTYDWGDDDEPSVVVDEDKALANLEKRIETITRAAGADTPIICLSDPSRRYFRHDIYPDYKGNRRGTPPPVLLGAMKDFLRENYKSYWKPKLEADDVLGILGTSTKFVKGVKVIATTDKDLLQIPGLHLNTNDIEGGVFEVTPEDGKRWHLIQTLTGDTVDGYPGTGYHGKKRAPKIVDGLDPFSREAWDAVVEAYVSRGHTPEIALQRARLAYMLQAHNWNNKTKEIIHFEPPDS